MAFQNSNDDIALIELAQSVKDIAAAPLYRYSDEQSKVVELLGRGATGNGLIGQQPGSHRGFLRRAYSRIVAADGKWLLYRFNSGSEAQPLEGMMGDGDSGGPVLINVAGTWHLAGLASHKFWSGDLSGFHWAFYGQTAYQVRISYYISWIDSVVTPRTTMRGFPQKPNVEAVTKS